MSKEFVAYVPDRVKPVDHRICGPQPLFLAIKTAGLHPHTAFYQTREDTDPEPFTAVRRVIDRLINLQQRTGRRGVVVASGDGCHILYEAAKNMAAIGAPLPHIILDNPHFLSTTTPPAQSVWGSAKFGSVECYLNEGQSVAYQFRPGCAHEFCGFFKPSLHTAEFSYYSCNGMRNAQIISAIERASGGDRTTPFQNLVARTQIAMTRLRLRPLQLAR